MKNGAIATYDRLKTVKVVSNNKVLFEVTPHSSNHIAKLTHLSCLSFNEEKDTCILDLSSSYITKPQLTLIEFTLRNLLQRNQYALKEISMGTISALQLTDLSTNTPIAYGHSFIRHVLDEGLFSQNSQFVIPWECNGSFTHVLTGTAGMLKLEIENDKLMGIVKLSQTNPTLQDNKLTLPCMVGDLVFDLNQPVAHNNAEFNEFILSTLQKLHHTHYRY
jgi:hypothetical protein